MSWIFRVGLLLSLVTLFWVYKGSFNNGFYFDDEHTIVQNEAIRHLDQWPTFFKDATTFSSLPRNRAYRPVTTWLNAWDFHQAQGLDQKQFHRTNLLLHLLGMVGLYLLVVILLRKSQLPPNLSEAMALTAAILFGFNAVNAETLNYVIARSDLLANAMVIWTLVVYLWPMGRKIALYLVPLVIGILTKQTGFVAVPLIVLLEIWFGNQGSKFSIGRIVKRSFISIIVGFGLVGFNHWVMTPASTVSSAPHDPLTYALGQLYVNWHYITQMFWPDHLTADPDFTLSFVTATSQVIQGIICLVVLLTALTISWIKKWQLAGFGWCWMLVAAAPTSLVPLFQIANDHRIPLLLMGVVIAIVGHLSVLFQTEKAMIGWGSTGLLVLTLLTLHLPVIQTRNQIWSTAESLWKDVTIKSPKNGRGFMNYGLALMERGAYQEAERAYLTAIQIAPEFSYTYLNLAILKGAKGQHEQAIFRFKQALALEPNNPDFMTYYGRYWMERQFYAKSRVWLEKAINISPTHILANQLLPRVYDLLRETQAQWAPTIERQIDKVAADPNAKNWIDLSLLYYKAGEFEQCINSCEQALKIAPNNTVALNNMCTAYNHLGQFEKAILSCEKALAIDPNFELAKGNLVEAKLGAGER